MPKTPDYWHARILLERGLPLPIDLAARLDAAGCDLTALQDRYAR